MDTQWKTIPHYYNSYGMGILDQAEEEFLDAENEDCPYTKEMIRIRGRKDLYPCPFSPPSTKFF